MRAYSELYLEDSMRTLGEAFDYSIFYGISLKEFVNHFLYSGYARRFGNGEAAVISGISGVEMVMKIYNETENVDWEDFPLPEPRFEASEHYWCGHILAYYQWSRNISFKEIFSLVSVDEVLSLYPTLHEASEERAAYSLDHIIASRRKNRLREMRKINRLTQKELSEITGVGLRAIQQYEIGAKDINKASALSVRNLAKALHCEIEDLLSVPLPSTSDEQ